MRRLLCCFCLSTIRDGVWPPASCSITIPAVSSRFSPQDPNPPTSSTPRSWHSCVNRGLDPGREFAKPLTDGMARAADVIVMMGRGDT
jgi:hypothetical protein